MTGVWNHNNKKPEVVLCSSWGLISRSSIKGCSQRHHIECQHWSVPWAKRSLAAGNICHGPLAKGPWSVALFLERFLGHERNHDGVQYLGKRDLNADTELLETFAKSPLELSHGMVECSPKPPSWSSVLPSWLWTTFCFQFSSERPVFHFLLVPKYVYNKHYAFGT